MARYSDQQIENALRKTSFSEMVDELLTRGYTHNLVGGILLDRGRGVSVSVTRIDTMETEHHSFTIAEFVEMLGRVKDARGRRYPQYAQQLTQKYEEFKDAVLPEEPER